MDEIRYSADIFGKKNIVLRTFKLRAFPSVFQQDDSNMSDKHTV